jgi:hypothetical protein
VNLVPIPDVGWAFSVLFLGVGALVVLAPLTVLGEAAVLRWLLPGGRPLRNSLLANLASGMLGYGGLALGGPSFFNLGDFVTQRTGGDYFSAPDIALAAYLLIFMAIFWLVSVAVEGVALMVLDRDRPVRRVWLASLVANVCSYAVILIALFAVRVVDWTG